MISAEFDMTGRRLPSVAQVPYSKPVNHTQASMGNINSVYSEPELGPIGSKNQTQRAIVNNRPLVMFTKSCQSTSQFQSMKRVDSSHSSLVR